MPTRTIDAKGRILLPAEALARYSDGHAYFAYSPRKQEVYIVNALRVREKLTNRTLALHMASSSINKNGRVIMPEMMRLAAGLKSGEVLELRVVEEKGIALKKFNQALVA